MSDIVAGASPHVPPVGPIPVTDDMASLLAIGRERFHLDLVVLAGGDGPDGEWCPIASSFWADSSGPGTSDLRDVVRIPLRRADGRTLGVLCAFTQHPDQRLRQRDADALYPFAELLIELIVAGSDDWTRPSTARALLRRLDEAGGPMVWFQPAYHLSAGAHAGYEALARFPLESPSPTDWFRAAELVGRRVELELSAIRAALAHLPHLEGRVSLNVSESTLLDPRFLELMEPAVAAQVVLELTEQYSIDDYSAVRGVLAELRARGAMLAIDDVGSGFSSLRHVLELDPEIIKLDIGLVHAIDGNSQQQALVRSLTDFAHQTGIHLVAEGIETPAELATLVDLGVEWGQGFHLGAPIPCPGHVWSVPPRPVLAQEA